MREAEVRELLEAAAGGEAPPSGVDLDRAVRDGRRTRTTRRAFLAGGTALGVSAVLGTTATLRRSRADRTATGWPWPPPVYGPLGGPSLPAIPERFDLFGQWAVFGWLPFTPARLSYYAEPDTYGVEAEGDRVIRLALIREPLAADELARKGTSEDAPPVAGSPARWLHTRGGLERESLQWRVASSWAQVSTVVSSGEPGQAERRAMLHRVASDAGLSTDRRQRFPFRARGVPAGIPLARVEVILTAAGHWDVRIVGGVAASFGVSLTNVPVSMRPIEPSVRVEPVPATHVPATPEITEYEVDGLPGTYFRGEVSEFVIADRPDGVTVRVSASFDALRQLGSGGVLGLYRTVEVLNDPATWTEHPL